MRNLRPNRRKNVVLASAVIALVGTLGALYLSQRQAKQEEARQAAVHALGNRAPGFGGSVQLPRVDCTVRRGEILVSLVNESPRAIPIDVAKDYVDISIEKKSNHVPVSKFLTAGQSDLKPGESSTVFRWSTDKDERPSGVLVAFVHFDHNGVYRTTWLPGAAAKSN